MSNSESKYYMEISAFSGKDCAGEQVSVMSTLKKGNIPEGATTLDNQCFTLDNGQSYRYKEKTSEEVVDLPEKPFLHVPIKKDNTTTNDIYLAQNYCHDLRDGYTINVPFYTKLDCHSNYPVISYYSDAECSTAIGADVLTNESAQALIKSIASGMCVTPKKPQMLMASNSTAMNSTLKAGNAPVARAATEAPSDASLPSLDSPGFIALITVGSVVLLFIIVLLAHMLRKRVRSEKDTARRLEQRRWDRPQQI